MQSKHFLLFSELVLLLPKEDNECRPTENHKVLNQRKRKKTKKLKQFWNNLCSLFTKKSIVINSTESAQIDKEITVNLPDGILAVLTIMTTVLNLGLYNRNDNELIKDTEHLVLDLQIQTFSEKIIFNKDEFIGLLIMLNKKLNEMLVTECHTEKRGIKK